MNQNVAVESYIQQKIAELEQEKDLKVLGWKDQLSFGMDAKTYSHLPSWQKLIQEKKLLSKILWVNAFMLSLIIVMSLSSFWEKFEINWIKAIVGLIGISAITALYYVIGGYYFLFFRFRKTENEARKLIYEDILEHLKKEQTV